MHEITRRAALRGTAAVATCAAVAGAAQAAGTQGPLLPLRAERERLKAAMSNLPNTHEGDESGFALVPDLCRAEVRILSSDAQTFADALVQLEQVCLWSRDGVVVGGDEAIDRLIRVLPARIERLVGEG